MNSMVKKNFIRFTFFLAGTVIYIASANYLKKAGWEGRIAASFLALTLFTLGCFLMRLLSVQMIKKAALQTMFLLMGICLSLTIQQSIDLMQMMNVETDLSSHLIAFKSAAVLIGGVGSLMTYVIVGHLSNQFGRESVSSE